MQNSAPQHKSASGRFRRYALRSIAALCVLAATAIVAVWGTAEWRLHQQWPVVVAPLRIQPSPTLAAVGERNFHIFGCYGCHKEAGNVLFEAPYVGRLVAPNITRRAKAYSDEALLRLIRYGVKQDGTTAIAMPARVLGRIADQDVAAIISYVRSLPERPDSVSSPGQWGPLGYLALVLNKVPRSAALAENSHPPATRPEDGEGAYLVGAICRECHELDQTHNDGWGMVTPPLRAMAKAYSPEDFRRLLRTGEATGGRNAGLMSAIAKIDLSHLTNGEIDAIHNYLRSGT